MSEHRVTLTMGPLPADVRAVYERRGIPAPDMSTPHSEAALWPYLPRTRHRRYARANGYFWLECLLCCDPFGGHEITASIPDPTDEHMFTSICPACAARRHGGQP